MVKTGIIRRLTVEECHCISAVTFRQDGVFKSPRGSRWVLSFSPILRLEHTVWEVPGCALGLYFESHVPGHWIRITTTKPPFGGRRYWFQCPLSNSGRVCGRRVGRLYLPPGSAFFGCRICHNLTYRSAQTHDKRRDALLRNPDLLLAALNSRDHRQVTLGIRTVRDAMYRMRARV
jgi:hypothetical protein